MLVTELTAHWPPDDPDAFLPFVETALSECWTRVQILTVQHLVAPEVTDLPQPAIDAFAHMFEVARAKVEFCQSARLVALKNGIGGLFP